MISVRIVNVDYYMNPPLHNLDIRYSEFRAVEVKQVPVIQVFGALQTGHKTCVNIHGVLPYIYIPYDGSEPAGSLSYKIAAELDKALNTSLGQASSNTVHVHNIVLVSSRPFYGYHEKNHQFFKLYFYNPHILKKACSLLENGAILGKIFQPFESHINYILQFMIDYNLFGMSFLNISGALYRPNPADPNLLEDLPSYLVLPKNIPRRSTCKYELDVLASNILNKDEISSGKVTVNPGIAALWADEKQRRRDKEEDSQISFKLTQERHEIPPTDSHNYFANLLTEKLSQKSDESSLDLDKSVYPAETPECSDIINANHSILDVSLSNETIVQTDEDAKLLKVLQELKASSKVEDERLLKVLQEPKAGGEVEEDRLLKVLQELKTEEVEVNQVEGDSVLNQMTQEEAESSDEDLDLSLPLKNAILEDDSIWENSFWDECEKIPQIDGQYDTDSDENELETEIDLRMADEVYIGINNFQKSPRRKLNRGLNKLIVLPRKLSKNEEKKVEILEEVFIKPAQQKEDLEKNDCKQLCLQDDSFDENNENVVINDVNLASSSPFEKNFADLSFESLLEADATPDFSSLGGTTNELKSDDYCSSQIIEDDFDNLFQSEENLAPSPEIPPNFDTFDELLLIANEIHEDIKMPTQDSEIFAQKDEEIDELPLQENHTTNINEEIIKLPKFNIVENKNKNKKRERIKKTKTKRQLKKVVKISENEEISSQENEETDKTKIRRSSAVKKRANKKNRNSTSRPKNDESSENEEISAQRNVKKGKTKTPKLNTVKSIIKGESKNGKTSIVEEISTEENPKIKRPRGRPKKKKNTPKRSHKSSEDMLDIKVPREMIDLVMQIKSCPKLVEKFEAKSNVSLEEEKISKLIQLKEDSEDERSAEVNKNEFITLEVTNTIEQQIVQDNVIIVQKRLSIENYAKELQKENKNLPEIFIHEENERNEQLNDNLTQEKRLEKIERTNKAEIDKIDNQKAVLLSNSLQDNIEENIPYSLEINNNSIEVKIAIEKIREMKGLPDLEGMDKYVEKKTSFVPKQNSVIEEIKSPIIVKLPLSSINRQALKQKISSTGKLKTLEKTSKLDKEISSGNKVEESVCSNISVEEILTKAKTKLEEMSLNSIEEDLTVPNKEEIRRKLREKIRRKRSIVNEELIPKLAKVSINKQSISSPIMISSDRSSSESPIDIKKLTRSCQKWNLDGQGDTTTTDSTSSEEKKETNNKKSAKVFKKKNKSTCRAPGLAKKSTKKSKRKVKFSTENQTSEEEDSELKIDTSKSRKPIICKDIKIVLTPVSALDIKQVQFLSSSENEGKISSKNNNFSTEKISKDLLNIETSLASIEEENITKKLLRKDEIIKKKHRTPSVSSLSSETSENPLKSQIQLSSSTEEENTKKKRIVKKQVIKKKQRTQSLSSSSSDEETKLKRLKSTRRSLTKYPKLSTKKLVDYTKEVQDDETEIEALVRTKTKIKRKPKKGSSTTSAKNPDSEESVSSKQQTSQEESTEDKSQQKLNSEEENLNASSKKPEKDEFINVIRQGKRTRKSPVRYKDEFTTSRKENASQKSVSSKSKLSNIEESPQSEMSSPETKKSPETNKNEAKRLSNKTAQKEDKSKVSNIEELPEISSKISKINTAKRIPMIVLTRVTPEQLSQNSIITISSSSSDENKEKKKIKIDTHSENKTLAKRDVESRKKIVNNSSPARYTALNVTRSPRKLRNLDQTENEPVAKKQRCIPEGISPIVTTEQNNEPKEILDVKSAQGTGEWQKIEIILKNSEKTTPPKLNTEKCVPKNCDIVNNQNNLNSPNSIKQQLFNSTINYSKNYSSTPKSKITPLRDINGNFDHIQEIRKKEEQFLQEFDQNNSTDITNHQNIEIYHKTVNNNLEINSGSNSSSKNVNITENNILEISQSPVKLINQVNPYKPVKRKDKKPVPFTEARDFDYIYFSPIKKKVTKNTSNDIIETLSQQDAKVLQNIDEFNTKITNLTVAELYDLQKDFAPQPCCSKTVQEENSPVLFSNDFSLFENTLEETINEIIVEETEPETVNYSYNCWMPKFLPPSKEHIFKTLKNYNIPENRFQEPFYSNCTDVTGTIDIGNNVLKISSNTATDFDEFNCCVEFIGLEKWRKNKFKEICPTDTTIKNIKVTLAGHKRIVITPVIQPPKREVILKWIEDENNKIEAKQNKIEKPRIIIPQSPTNSNDSFNESLTLTPDTPQSSKLSQNIIDSSQTPSKKFRSQNLQRKVLFPQKPNSNDSCRITGVTLDNSHDFKMSFANYQDAKAISEPENLTILVVELHIRTRGDFYPDPKYDSIRAIFYSILNDVPENFELPQKETGILVVDSLPGSPSKENLPILNGTGINCNLIYVKSELELIEEFIKLIRKWDPDIFTGFEIELLSWGYLIERCYVLEINLPIQISRINPDVIKNKNINFEGELRLTGRIILDGWRLFRNEIALQSYTFENLMFHILHQRVPAHSFKNLSFWWEHRSNYYRYITVNYYLTRVEGILKLFEQLDVIGRTCELARLFGIQFYEVLSRGSQFRVESMMLRLAKPLNFVPVSPSVQQRAKMRAPEWIPLIFEPESRFYSDPIIVLDFQSLYPSIIIAYNYCFSTCIGRVQKLGTNIPFEFGACQLKIPRKLLEKLQDKINFSPCGVGFVKPEIRKGILPQMLTEILETRLMVKASMKENKNNKLLQRVLHNRQLGLKLIANVTYGYTSANFSGRMPCIEIADSVVSKGRETLERAIKLIDQTDKWCARVVYGDTDSLFVQVPGRTKEDAFKIGAEIAEAVTNANPPPVKLKLEKIYMPCILQTKKRYVGYMYESPDQKEAEYNAKGIETVRRDGCPAVAKMLEKSLRILFETKDMSLVKRYTLRQFEKLLTGRASIQDLTFAKEFRGLSGYRPGACVPALELARRWTSVDHRREPRRKERVPYIIVHGPPGVPLIRLVKSPMELLNPEHTSLRPNAVYYITRVIAPPLNRCLRLIGADVLAWFNDMPRKKLQILPTDIHFVESKKSTISQYFATMSCVVCNNQTRDGLCEACCDNPQQSMVVLHGKLQKWERSFDEVGQICQSCCGRSEHTDCISLDCPVLYRLHQIKKDLKQVPFVRNLFSKL